MMINRLYVRIITGPLSIPKPSVKHKPYLKSDCDSVFSRNYPEKQRKTEVCQNNGSYS